MVAVVAGAIAAVPAACSNGRPGPVDGLPEVRHYTCYRAPAPLVVDGRLSETAWVAAPWSEAFVDIRGAEHPAPESRTRVKLLWDDTYLYVGAELEEPDVWATLTARDAVIYQDDDFEVFIDPDGDTHFYYEVEINAFGTVWDLLLEKPYRDGGPAVSAWDMAGMRSAVAVDGTVNLPGDRDSGWSVELALPWAALAAYAPERRPPRDGEQWRINFSRVDWDVEVAQGRYRKMMDPGTGRPRPEHNWVWSPQGAVNMHMPERWGIVQFSRLPVGAGEAAFRTPPDEDVRWGLRQLYYAQRAFHRARGRYADDLAELGFAWPDRDGFPLEPDLVVFADGFEAFARGRDAAVVWRIRHDGRIWRE